MKIKVSKVILALMLTFIMTKNVYGATANVTGWYLKDDSGQWVYKNNNGVTGQQVKIIVTDTSTNEEHIGYCIDVGKTLDGGGYHITSESLYEYLNKEIKNEEKTRNAIKNINEYIYFGYEYNNQNSFEYYLATQKLIWDELYNAGHSQDSYNPNTYFYTDSGRIDISDEINTIKTTISKHYKLPSFCSSQSKIEIAIGETATYTDNNNVLTNYKVSCSDGLICESNGNTLKVTADKEGSEQKISFSKTIQGETLTLYEQEGKQSVIINKGELEPLSCEFGIDTYKNVQTSDMKIVYVITIGLFCGVMAYITYYTKKSLNGIK